MLSRNVGDVAVIAEQQTRITKIWNLYFWLGLGMNTELHELDIEPSASVKSAAFIDYLRYHQPIMKDSGS